MSTVLFDAPGPKAVRRHRLIAVATIAGLILIAARRRLEAGRRGPVHRRAVGTVRHARHHPGPARGSRADRPGGGRGDRRRRGLRRRLRGRQAVGPCAGAVAVLGCRRVLPSRAAADADHLHLVTAGLRAQLAHAARHRPDALQRLGPRRGVPGRHPRRPQGPVRGCVRDRHAQEPGHAHRPAAAGGQDHAPGDHQPVHRRAQGHEPRLLHPRSGAHREGQGDLELLRQQVRHGHRPRRSSTSCSTCCSRGWRPGSSAGSAPPVAEARSRSSRARCRLKPALDSRRARSSSSASPRAGWCPARPRCRPCGSPSPSRARRGRRPSRPRSSRRCR